MANKPFIINNRFLVSPALGTISVKNSNKETTVDPHLMHLLGILVMYNYEFVTSNQLAHQVWNYAGNDYNMLKEGISTLKLILEDKSHTLIKAAPQKGYMLQARITFDKDTKENINVPNGIPAIYWIIGVLLLVITVAWFVLSGRH